MADVNDMDLIREYADHRSEAAFAGLVRRHLNLVYSVALRFTGNSADAQDVAQAVFVILAQKSPTLRQRTTLTGWLYETTRLVARQSLRTRTRQQTRDQEAYMQSTLNEADTNGVWQQLAPLLEEGMSRLSEDDRALLALRYFENKSTVETAALLGIQEWAAHKRANRAVEKLRTFFTKRGLMLSATGLTTAIAANSIQAAPAGLAAAICAASLTGTAVATSAAVTATKTIAMTTFQKIAITATVAALVGTSLYEARQASLLRDQNQALRQRLSPLAEQLDKLQSERDSAINRQASLAEQMEKNKSDNGELLKLRGEITRLRADAGRADDPAQTAAKQWFNRVEQLKQRLAQTPGANIPELKLLDDEDWLAAVKNPHLESDVEYRRALSTLRQAAESKVASTFQQGLREFIKNNGKQFPTGLDQLQPYFDSPLDDAILQRWEITSPKTVPSLGVGTDYIITQKQPVDDVFDTRYAVGANGFGSTDFLSTETRNVMNPVYDAYRAAHNGEWPPHQSQLLPYATTPEQQTALQKLILRDSSSNGDYPFTPRK